VLEYLLQCGLPIDAVDNLGQTPLHEAAIGAPDELVDVLLRHEADRSIRDFNGHRPFHCAMRNRALKNPIQTVERLLCEEADIHQPDALGRTPLHLAASQGALAIVEWLLKKATNVGALDDLGRTALHLAASCRSTDSTDVLKCLLDFCDTRPNNLSGLINGQDSAKMTPLHHVFYTYNQLNRDAALDPAVTVANGKLLLSRGADLHARDNRGNTPLHMAAWRGLKELVKVFLLSGADPHAEDENALRPLDVAEMEDVREILESAMAEGKVDIHIAIR